MSATLAVIRVEGATVTFTATHGAALAVTAGGVSDAAGIATATLTDTRPVHQR
ncbi:Ig-like domain-containing protein [Mangrovibacter sp. SLW1]